MADLDRTATLDQEKGIGPTVQTGEVDDNAITDAKIATHTSTKITGLPAQTIDLNLGGNKLNLSAITLQEVSNVAEITIGDDIGGAGLKIQNTDGSILFSNGTSTANSFQPAIRCDAGGSNLVSTFLVPTIPVAFDTGTIPVMKIDMRQDDDTPIVNRPLLHIMNDGSVKLAIDKDGDITTGVWKGTVVASAFLDADTMHLGVAQLITANKTFSDNVNAVFGSGGDATIDYNGTDLVINPKVVGSGVLSVLGDISILDEDLIFGTTTGTKIGTATTQKIGFWNVTPVVQQAHIADPTAGAVIDAEARTAIDSILAQLATTGMQASS